VLNGEVQAVKSAPSTEARVVVVKSKLATSWPVIEGGPLVISRVGGTRSTRKFTDAEPTLPAASVARTVKR